MNGTYNTSNMYTDITRADITSIHTSQTNDNSITIQVQMPHMVRQIRFNTVATNNDVSVTWLGSSKRFSIQNDNDGSILSLGISKITTRYRRVSSDNPTKHDGEIRYYSTIDIDSHANTHCFGNNFRVVSSTEQLFSVTAFLEKLLTKNNVANVTTTTIMVDYNGKVFIWVFGERLGFAKKIQKGLINPNKFRSYGVKCFNKTTYNTGILVFYANNFPFPFKYQGNITPQTLSVHLTMSFKIPPVFSWVIKQVVINKM